jgi:chromate reductase
LKIAAIAGSLRAGSHNKQLLAVAVAAARARGAEVDVIDLRALELPLYDGDLEDSSGAPRGAVELKARLGAADAILVASPEYNGSVPGTFKNAIDWASRAPDAPFAGKLIALLSASTGGFGGAMGLLHLRQVLTRLGAWTLPSQVTVSFAHQAFTPEGEARDPKLQAQVDGLVAALLDAAGRRA